MMKRSLCASLVLSAALFVSCSIDDDSNHGIGLINIDRGLIAHYPLNGNVEDESDNEFDGTINGTPELVRGKDGENDTAYKFDDVSEFITLSDEIDDEMNEGGSISAWIYLDDGENGGAYSPQVFLHNFNAADSNMSNCSERVGFTLGLNADGSVYATYNTDVLVFVGRKTGVNKIERRKWHHVTMLYDGSMGGSMGYRLYVDGQRADVADVSQGQVDCAVFKESSLDFTLGVGTGLIGPNLPFTGVIDEVYFHDRILNEREIRFLARRS